MLTSSPDGFPVLESKNLVRRRFVMALGLIAVVGVIFGLLANSGTSDRVIGAGSTFAYPLIQSASGAYQDAKADGSDWAPGSTGVDYEPVGSLGGILRLSDPEVDFAISDYPLSAKSASDAGYVQFPIIIGSLVSVYNLPGVAGPLRLNAAVLGDIYLGKIANWSDPAIKALNQGSTLPDLPISVIQRADGSGSTLHFTTYLSRGSAGWKSAHGSSTAIQWPTGTGVRGSGEMAEAVKITEGAIGYLESGQAQRAGLAAASLENASGQFIASSPVSIEAAARGIDWTAAERTDAGPAGDNAYPIVTAAYVIMKRGNRAAQDNTRTLRFVQFIFDQRASDAKSLGYLPLPQSVVDSIKQVWSRELAHQS